MHNKKSTVASSVVGLVALLAVVTFLLIGFLTHVWSPTWLVFLAIPIVSIITDLLTKKKGLVSVLTGVVSLLAVIAFLLMGFLWGLWHPGWVVFFAIPISQIIAKMISGSNCAEDEADAPGPDQQA